MEVHHENVGKQQDVGFPRRPGDKVAIIFTVFTELEAATDSVATMKLIYLAATLLYGAAFVRSDACDSMYTCQSCIRRVNCTWCSEPRASSDKVTTYYKH